MKVLAIIVGSIAAVAVLALIMTLPVWWAWNTFAPSVLGLPSIGFWQAMALSILLATIGGASGGGKDSSYNAPSRPTTAV